MGVNGLVRAGFRAIPQDGCCLNTAEVRRRSPRMNDLVNAMSIQDVLDPRDGSQRRIE
jgi:hypothetical protein